MYLNILANESDGASHGVPRSVFLFAFKLHFPHCIAAQPLLVAAVARSACGCPRLTGSSIPAHAAGAQI